VKALVIDDNRSVRTFVERVLCEAGYETMSAKDGIAAQQLVLNAGSPHIVITDESMPRMSGHEFARWLRERSPRVKVLFLTGHISPAFGDPIEMFENEGYLEKPCTMRGLLQAVSLLMFRQLEPPAVLRQSQAP
jgi:two-component system cell cycle sensor histidine kinase/response regulator CckA